MRWHLNGSEQPSKRLVLSHGAFFAWWEQVVSRNNAFSRCENIGGCKLFRFRRQAKCEAFNLARENYMQLAQQVAISQVPTTYKVDSNHRNKI